MRIVSLLPSCTEIVCALGCAERLVGRSHNCDFPSEIQSVPVCTPARVGQLHPDIILTQAQDAGCALGLIDLEKALPQTRIISLSPARLADVWQDIQTIADALGVPEEGRALLSGLKNRVVDVILKTCLLKKKPSAACLAWLDPLMAAGNWMPEMVELAGGHDILGAPGRDAGSLEWEELAQADPDVIILMPCGFDLERTRREAAVLEGRPEWRKLRAVKSKNLFAADGNHYFNRPGPRVVESIEMLAEILQPKLFSFGHENRGWARL